MTSQEFLQLLERCDDQKLLQPCLHDDAPPYVCQGQPAAWDAFRDQIVAHLSITRQDIRVIGSGRFGFSLKPWSNLKRFEDTSDIDVIVVNKDLFDRLWYALLEAAYPRGGYIELKLGGWLRRRRNELYTGWLTPLKIKLDYGIVGPKAKPVLDFNARWFNALKEASRYPTQRHENISGRLYRTWRHAELYHLNSLAALRNTLTK